MCVCCACVKEEFEFSVSVCSICVHLLAYV